MFNNAPQLAFRVFGIYLSIISSSRLKSACMVSESVKLLSSAKGVSKLRSQPTKATTSLLFYHKTAFLHILKIFQNGSGTKPF